MSAVVRTIDGKQVTFRRFTAEEVIDFCEIAYQWRREQLLDEKKNGVDVKDALAMLLDQRGELDILWRYAKSPAGAVNVLKAAGSYEQAKGFDLWELVALSLEVCGFALPVADEKQPENGDGFERPM